MKKILELSIQLIVSNNLNSSHWREVVSKKKIGKCFLRFLPRQRWLHNIEHGAVVMLYHPCTHEATVDKLRRLVKGCITKHVISPSTFLTRDRVS